MEVPGRFVDARQNGGDRAAGDRRRAAADRRARRAVDDAVEARARFLGHTVLKSNLTGATFRRNLAPCDASRRPRSSPGSTCWRS